MPALELLPGCVPWPDEFCVRYRAAGYWAGETLGGFLSERAQQFGQRLALTDGRTHRSYAELECRAVSLAYGFQSCGLKKGDCVVVQLSNRVEWFEVCFALWKLGAVPVLAQPAHRMYELWQFVEQTQAVAYVREGKSALFDFEALGQALVEKSTSLEHVFVVGTAAEGRGAVNIESLMHDAHPLRDGASPSEVALLQLSGGSSGAPKLIPRTHDDYLYSVRRSAEICGFGAHTRYLAALPVAHNFPLSSPGALGVLHVGGRVILSQSPAPESVFPWIERGGVNATALVPSLGRLWHQAAERRGLSLANLSLLQVGGAKLDSSLARRLHEATCGGLQQVFGMAEGLVNYTLPGDSEELIVGTQGTPLSPSDEILIVDDSDRVVPAGCVGHLLTRGPYTIRGYFRSEAYNQTAFTKDGFYRTGDRVRQTQEGYLVVEGRSKDQINRGGEKISAQEVEIQLKQTGLVTEAALVARPDPYLGERSRAYVVVSDRSVEADVLKHALRDAGLAQYKVPDDFVLMTTLPKTAIGKVDKVALRRGNSSVHQAEAQVEINRS